MSKVLVTGGLGFIGSHTVDLLVHNGYEVVILDNLDFQVHHGQEPRYSNVKSYIIRDTVTKEISWRTALSGTEYIINLAALTGSSQSFWKINRYTNVNVMGVARLFQTLLKHKELSRNLLKVVNASSSYVYGEGSYLCSRDGIVFPGIRSLNQLREKNWDVVCPICKGAVKPVGVSELKPPQTPNPYSLTKFFAERLTALFGEYLDIPTLSFRYFNVYGSRQSLMNPYTGVLSIFYTRLVSGLKPIVFEDGLMSRDFVHVNDVAQFNLRALSRGHGVLNLGSGVSTNINKIFTILASKLDSDIDPQFVQESRFGDIRHIFSDNTKLKKTYGHYDFMKIRDGIDEFLEWARKSDTKELFDRGEKARKKFSPKL